VTSAITSPSLFPDFENWENNVYLKDIFGARQGGSALKSQLLWMWGYEDCS
jgi:hypothetical protein